MEITVNIPDEIITAVGAPELKIEIKGKIRELYGLIVFNNRQNDFDNLNTQINSDIDTVIDQITIS